jgi:hypothetical protein
VEVKELILSGLAILKTATRQGRSVHVLTGDEKRVLKFSFQFPYHLPFSAVVSAITVIIFCLLYWPALHAEHLPHHPRNHHFIIISGFAISFSVHYNSSFPTRFIYFLVIKVH